MGITRLNHAVLFVRDLETSVAFYTDVLGFSRIDMTPDGFAGAAFLQAPGSTNDHDLGLFEIGANAEPSGAGRTTVGLYHLAWEIDTLAEMKELATLLAENGALAGSSDHGTTKSLYGKDPDGLEFEIGSFRPIGSTRLPDRPASRSVGSTSPRRSPATAPRPAVGSAFRSRSPDGGVRRSLTGAGGPTPLLLSRHQTERRTLPSNASSDRISKVGTDDQRVRISEPLDEVGPGSLSLTGIEV